MQDSKHHSHISLSFKNVSCSSKYKYPKTDGLNGRSEFRNTIKRFKKQGKEVKTARRLDRPSSGYQHQYLYWKPIAAQYWVLNTAQVLDIFSGRRMCLHHRTETGIPLPCKIYSQYSKLGLEVFIQDTHK
jgi:hypothetical protein